MKKLLVAALVLHASIAFAGVTGLYNTGVADSGALLGPGTADPHYSLTSGPGAPAVAITPHPAYIAAGDSAMWISPGDASGTSGDLAGEYWYTLTFEISEDIDLDSLVVSGLWASDNDSKIYLNGEYTGFSRPKEGFQSLAAFSLTDGFQVGANTLQFWAINYKSTSPTALLVTDIAAVVPAPGAVVLGSLGMSLVGWLRRRRTL